MVPLDLKRVLTAFVYGREIENMKNKRKSEAKPEENCLYLSNCSASEESSIDRYTLYFSTERKALAHIILFRYGK